MKPRLSRALTSEVMWLYKNVFQKNLSALSTALKSCKGVNLSTKQMLNILISFQIK